jgi:UDP-N-acetylglucosamine 4,6-dehydratase/5-epimerase
MERVLVTGATGYIGEKLVEKLIQQGKYVHAVARNEGKLIELQTKHNNLEIFPCPIENEYLVKKAVKDCSGIFHLASFKHVNLAEKNALKTVETNICGTLNLLKASVDNKSIKFIVASSSDKAERIAGVYGASKFLVEKLFEEFNLLNSEHCKYRVVRYGNVLHSTSSVVEKWKKALAAGHSITITDASATRFFLTRDVAINAIFECLDKAADSRPYLPNMKSLSIRELLDLTILKYGKGRKSDIIEIGLQEGENKHEQIDPHNTSEFAPRWDKQELYNEL